MGVDSYVHLRVRDRAALRRAFERNAPEGEGMPLFSPHGDGSVSVFTGLRFHDQDFEFAIRSWLHAVLGDELARIHDDPRGVFVTPDVCEPRSDTYDGIVGELASAGRWVDPRPPTQAERDQRMRELEELIEGMARLREADERGEGALAEALAAVPAHVRATWEAQRAAAARWETLGSRYPIAIELGSADEESGEESDAAAEAAAEAMFADLLAKREARAKEPPDPRGRGRIAAAVPQAVWAVLEKNEDSFLFEVDAHFPLKRGGALVVTTRLGRDDEPFMAQCLAQVVEEAGLDRNALGPLPFFRESLVDEVRDANDVGAVVTKLGDRAREIPLRTSDEAFEEERAKTLAWLRSER